MNDSDTLALLTICLCLVGSVFFSGSETAITAFGDHRARKLVEDGGRRGQIANSWVVHPIRVLSTILLGNNLTNTLMATMIAAIVNDYVKGGEWQAYAVPIAVGGSTALLLIFGEIIPKALGRIYCRELAIPALWVLAVFGKLTFPFVWALSHLSQLIIGRAQEHTSDGERVTIDELGYLVKVGRRQGSIPVEQAEMLQGVFRFEDKYVRDIMVPLERVSAVELGWDIDRIRGIAKRTGHSRLPVYDGDLDSIEGVLHIKQLVAVERDRFDATYLRGILRPALFVGESMLLRDLLRSLKDRRVHLAIVVDDAGHTVGVVTLEDVLEQIVGQIFDESDRAPRQQLAERHGMYYVDGQTSLAKVEDFCSHEFPPVEGVDSVGDLLTRLAGQMPIAGSVFVWESLRFKVLSATKRRIARISVERVDPDLDV